MAQMMQDAQETEAARQAEAAEYERVIRRQRQSATEARSITDALVEQVQELHYASLAREEVSAVAPVATTPAEPHPDSQFLRDYQMQTASLQRIQQTVDQLTLLLPPNNPLVFRCFRLAGSFSFLCVLHHLCHRGLHGRETLDKSRVIHRSS